MPTREPLLRNWYGFRVKAGKAPTHDPGVYIITNRENGKQYIGSSKDIAHRFSRGWRQEAVHPTTLLGKNIKKQGRQTFLVEVLLYVSSDMSKEDLSFCETMLIRKYNTLSPNGYNVVRATTSKEIFAEIQNTPELEKKRIRGIRRYLLTDKGRKQIQAIWTPEHKAKIAAARKRPEVVAKRLEIFHSKEFREKVSNNSKASWQNESTRKKITKAVRSAWSDPTLRKEQSERLSAYLATPEGRAQRSKTSLAVAARPGYKEAMSAKLSSLIWINNGVKNTRISKNLPIPDGWRHGRYKVN